MRKLNWGGDDYPQYDVEVKSGKSQEQKMADQFATQDQATAQHEIGQNDTTLGYFSGANPTETGLYKDLYSKGIESTNAAYDSAKSANKLRARVAGFGYEQPIADAADQGVELARANSVAGVPRTALLDTIQPMLQGAQVRAGEAASQTSGADSTLSTANQAEEARQANQTAMITGLVQGGLSAVNPWMPKFKKSGG